MDDKKQDARQGDAPPERHLRLVPRPENVRRKFGRRKIGWALASLATLAVLVGGLSLMQPALPGPELPGDGARPIGMQRDLPPDTGDIQIRLHALQLALEREDWAEIERAASDLRQTWVAYRPRMQAFAGSRAWTTYHISDFEERLARLGQRVEARDLSGVNNEADALANILRNYLTTPQRLQELPLDPQPRSPGASG